MIARTAGKMPLRAAITQLYGYIYCMILSNMLTDIPMYGGVLYLCGKAVIVFAGIYGVSRPNEELRVEKSVLVYKGIGDAFYGVDQDDFTLWRRHIECKNCTGSATYDKFRASLVYLGGAFQDFLTIWAPVFS